MCVWFFFLSFQVSITNMLPTQADITESRSRIKSTAVQHCCRLCYSLHDLIKQIYHFPPLEVTSAVLRGCNHLQS